MASNELLRIATAELGVKETAGTESNSRIMEYAKGAGFDWYKNDETPWCSVFLNWAANQAGLERSKEGMARSWQKVGVVVTNPEPGDVVLVTNTPGSKEVNHVGIFNGFSEDGTRIYLLGGNQSDTVSITGYKKNLLVEYRRLAPVGTPAVAESKVALKKGDKGKDVIALQDGLKLAGFSTGTSDGSFGPMTETAVKAAQKKGGLPETGIYDEKTREYLLSVLPKAS